MFILSTLSTDVAITIVTAYNITEYEMYVYHNIAICFLCVSSRSFAKGTYVGCCAPLRIGVVAVERRFRSIAVAPSHPAKA